MNQEFLDRLEQWNEEDKYQEIIDAIEALPEGELNFTLTSALARAYNNLAMDLMPPEDRPLYQRALDLLLPLEDRLEEAVKQDPDVAHTWHFRVAYAYFYLDQESLALPHFEKALEARPGDEDTLELIDRCQRSLALPVGIKPFRARTEEAWDDFLEGEKELRELMDREDREAVGEKLVDRCAELLSTAFADVAFELGHNGEKYELILVPEGDRTRLFQLAYFQKRAPKELLDRWNILVGRTRSSGFGLRMNGQDITPEDVQVWAEKTEDNGVGLRLYCEKLAPLWKEDQNQVYHMIYILLDQSLGELAAMRYVDYLDILDAPAEGAAMTLDQLADFISRGTTTTWTASTGTGWSPASSTTPWTGWTGRTSLPCGTSWSRPSRPGAARGLSPSPAGPPAPATAIWTSSPGT